MNFLSQFPRIQAAMNIQAAFNKQNSGNEKILYPFTLFAHDTGKTEYDKICHLVYSLEILSLHLPNIMQTIRSISHAAKNTYNFVSYPIVVHKETQDVGIASFSGDVFWRIKDITAKNTPPEYCISPECTCLTEVGQYNPLERKLEDIITISGDLTEEQSICIDEFIDELNNKEQRFFLFEYENEKGGVWVDYSTIGNACEICDAISPLSISKGLENPKELNAFPFGDYFDYGVVFAKHDWLSPDYLALMIAVFMYFNDLASKSSHAEILNALHQFESLSALAKKMLATPELKLLQKMVWASFHNWESYAKQELEDDIAKTMCVTDNGKKYIVENVFFAKEQNPLLKVSDKLFSMITVLLRNAETGELTECSFENFMCKTPATFAPVKLPECFAKNLFVAAFHEDHFPQHIVEQAFLKVFPSVGSLIEKMPYAPNLEYMELMTFTEFCKKSKFPFKEKSQRKHLLVFVFIDKDNEIGEAVADFQWRDLYVKLDGKDVFYSLLNEQNKLNPDNCFSTWKNKATVHFNDFNLYALKAA